MKNVLYLHKSTTRRFTAAAFLLLTVQAWVLPFTSVASALCVGEDGHVEVEAWTNGQCASDHTDHEDHEEPAALTASCEPSDDHCGDCVDIPLNGLDAACIMAKANSNFSQKSLPAADSFAVTTIQPNAAFRSENNSRLLPAHSAPVYVLIASFLI